MKGFLDAKHWEPLDLGDLIVEILVMLRLLRPLEAINSSPNSVEILCYLFFIFALRPECSLVFLLCFSISTFYKVSDVFFVSTYFFFFRSPFSFSYAPFFFVFISVSVLRFLYDRFLSVGAVHVSHPVEVVRGDDLVNVVDLSDSPKQVISRVEFGWVDPKVTGITSTFSTEESVAKFLGRYPILKVDARPSFFSVEPCLPTENVCIGWSGTGPPFFYMYSCLFSDLHVSLHFDNFTMVVLQTLNVGPTQLHPNTWRQSRPFAWCVTSCVCT